MATFNCQRTKRMNGGRKFRLRHFKIYDFSFIGPNTYSIKQGPAVDHAVNH